MRLADVVKSPGDVLDYEIDFSRWLPAGDGIVAAGATIEGGDAAIDSVAHSDTQAKVWISGGTEGAVCEVEVSVTTAGGRTKTACLRLKIREC